MEEGKKYAITFPKGEVIRVKLLRINSQDMMFQYLEGETYKPMSPLEPSHHTNDLEDVFFFPKGLSFTFNSEEISE